MLIENITLAFSTLMANRMRALLTMLGIIIGIASVIAIVTIGNGMTAAVNENLSSFGTNNITVFVQEKSMEAMMMGPGGPGGPGGGNVMVMAGPPMGGGGGGTRTFTVMSRRGGGGEQNQPEDSDYISMDTINSFEDAYPDEVEAVSVNVQMDTAQAKDGDLYANIAMVATNAGYATAENITMLQGRYISDKDLESARNVAVVSDKFVENMFKSGVDPISQQVSVYREKTIEIYTIIGVYQYEASAFNRGGQSASDQDLSTNFYVPVTLAKQESTMKNYPTFTVIAKNGTDIIAFTDEIKSYFADIYKNNATWGISAYNMESGLNTILSTIAQISMAIALIAAISLLVGGIGIMNIMLVSVTERTREIGTRKALGAKNFHIRLQFITEAVIISGIGGLIGVLLGSVVGGVVSTFMEAPVKISVTAIFVSVIFSMVIGIFFGYYPANKASKLDPIDALRYE